MILFVKQTFAGTELRLKNSEFGLRVFFCKQRELYLKGDECHRPGEDCRHFRAMTEDGQDYLSKPGIYLLTYKK
mgnify:CR=1 FL=1